LHANQVQKADLNAVEDAIRCGGLAQIKAARIANILNTLLEERGSICLEYVRNMTSDQIKAELSRFKGVGPKTVRVFSPTILLSGCVIIRADSTYVYRQRKYPSDYIIFFPPGFRWHAF
jgi:endonuclease III